MGVLSTLQTPLASPVVNPDGTINHIWNEFFVRLMKNAGVVLTLADIETAYEELQTQVDSISTELTNSIIITDSDSNPGSSLEVLYDGNRASGGIEYTVSGTDKFIQYEYGIEDYIDRIGIWVSNANGRIYVGYSSDDVTWNWLKAETDHTLDTEGKFETATSQSDAATNYLQLEVGQNIAIFPNNVFARYVKVFFTGSYTTTVYEFIPSRILIAEMAAIGDLSAINGTFTGKVVVGSGSSGYDNLGDIPTSLGDINNTESMKLISIAEGADVTAASAFVTSTYPDDKANLEAAIDNKIISWFQSTDPATDDPVWGGLVGTDLSHAGDMWWNTSTNILKRYSGSVWSSPIEDQKAIDAYSNAATAQDTADNKRRVFVSTPTVPTPTVPYDIGDLWDTGHGLKRATVNKSAEESYSESDWAYASDVTPSLPSDENLVGYWSMDEGSGSVVKDSSGNGNDGTIGAGHPFVVGVSGKALTAASGSEGVNCGNDSSLNFGTTSFSISLWVKYPALANPYWMLSHGTAYFAPGYGISCYEPWGLGADVISSLYLYDSVGVQLIISSGRATREVWHHLVYTVDRTNDIGLAYRAGELISDDTGVDLSTLGDITTADDLMLLAYGTSDFQGSMDEVRFYNEVLTAQEIKALYLNPGGNKSPIPGADVTQRQLDLGAAIDYAKANGVTLIEDGYIRTSLLSTSVLLVGDADLTQVVIDAGAAIDNAIVNGFTLMAGGYIRTSLLSTDVLIVGGNAGDLATQDRIDLDYTDGADGTQAVLDLGANIAAAKINGTTLIDGGYIRTSFLNTDVLLVGDADLTDYSTVNTFPTTETGFAVKTGNIIAKSSVANAWDSRSFSTVGYVQGAMLSFIAGVSGAGFTAGLDIAPSSSSVYYNIDHCFYLASDGSLYRYNNSSGTYLSTWVAGDFMEIVYDGANVQYSKNGSVLSTVTETTSSKLYFVSAFLAVDSKLTNLKFTAYADATAQNTAANAAAYTGSSIATTYTAAKCTDPDADATQAALTAGADIVNAMVNGVTFISGGYIRTALLDADTVHAGLVTLKTTGSLKTLGKDSFSDTTAGVFIGYDGTETAYTLAIGDGTKSIKWDGTDLTVTGDIITSGNLEANAATNQKNYFLATGVSAGNGTTYATVTITSTGAPTQLSITLQLASSFSGSISFAVKRGSTTLATYTTAYTINGAMFNATLTDTSTDTGSRTYTVVGSGTPSNTVTISNRSLVVLETKK